MGLESFDGGNRPEPPKWLCPRCGVANDFHQEVLRVARLVKSPMRCQKCDRPSALSKWEGAKGATQSEVAEAAEVDDGERDERIDRDGEE